MPERPERLLVSSLCILLAILVIASVLLGPLVTGRIVQRTSADAIDQFRGSEGVSLLIVVPILILAVALFRHSNPIGPYLALAGALFCTYTYITVIVGQEYLHYDGNVERAFPLYAGMVALGTTISVMAWQAVREATAVSAPPKTRRRMSWGLIALGTIVALMWAAQIWQVYRGAPDTAYTESPTLFWTIKLLDYGFVIPVAFLLADGVQRDRHYAFEAGTALLCFFTILATGITAMAVSTMLSQGSAAQLPLIIVLSLIVAGFIFVDARLLGRIAAA
ncbi:MAG: hypothetical protein QM753_02490 [Thermomicrobiales bacterium]